MSTQIEERITLFQFIDEHARTSLELSLLYFWSRYPNAMFTSGAIAGAIGHKRGELEPALEKFVKSGLVDRHARQSVFYSLTADRRKREYVRQLSAYAGRLSGPLPTGLAKSHATAPFSESLHRCRDRHSSPLATGRGPEHLDECDRYWDAGPEGADLPYSMPRDSVGARIWPHGADHALPPR